MFRQTSFVSSKNFVLAFLACSRDFIFSVTWDISEVQGIFFRASDATFLCSIPYFSSYSYFICIFYFTYPIMAHSLAFPFFFFPKKYSCLTFPLSKRECFCLKLYLFLFSGRSLQAFLISKPCSSANFPSVCRPL